MSHAQFELLSNQAVAVCAAAYFLALLAHLMEWAAARSVPEVRRSGTAESPAAAEAAQLNAGGATDVLERADVDTERVEKFARLGVVSSR